MLRQCPGRFCVLLKRAPPIRRFGQPASTRSSISSVFFLSVIFFININISVPRLRVWKWIEVWLVFHLSGFVQNRSVGLQAEEAEGVSGLRGAGRSGVLSRSTRHRRWALPQHTPRTGTHHRHCLLAAPNLLPWQLITIIWNGRLSFQGQIYGLAPVAR